MNKSDSEGTQKKLPYRFLISRFFFRDCKKMAKLKTRKFKSSRNLRTQNLNILVQTQKNLLTCYSNNIYRIYIAKYVNCLLVLLLSSVVK